MIYNNTVSFGLQST